MNDLKTRRSREESRKKMIEAMMGQKRGRTEMAGGRAIPYHWGEGLADIGTTLINKSNLSDSNDNLAQIEKDEKAASQAKIAEILAIQQGAPAVDQKGGPRILADGEDYEQFSPAQPAIAGDPIRAAMMAASSDLPDAAKTIMGKVAAGGNGGNPFYTALYGKNGEILNHNARTGDITPTEYSGAKYNPALHGDMSYGKEEGKLTAQADIKPLVIKAESEAKRAFSMSGIGELIAQAKRIMLGLETGNTPTASGIGTGVDWAGAMFGMSPDGSVEAKKLKGIGGALTSKMPRMEGPQSDKDTLLYREMAGQVGDSTLPTDQRIGALEEVQRIWSKYETKQPNSEIGVDVSKPPPGWDVEDYKYLEEDEKREAHRKQ